MRLKVGNDNNKKYQVFVLENGKVRLFNKSNQFVGVCSLFKDGKSVGVGKEES